MALARELVCLELRLDHDQEQAPITYFTILQLPFPFSTLSSPFQTGPFHRNTRTVTHMETFAHLHILTNTHVLMHADMPLSHKNT